MIKEQKDYLESIHDLYMDGNIDELEQSMNWHQCQCNFAQARHKDLYEWHKKCFETCQYYVDMYYMVN